jgi:hypothetical protein
MLGDELAGAVVATLSKALINPPASAGGVSNVTSFKTVSTTSGLSCKPTRRFAAAARCASASDASVICLFSDSRMEVMLVPKRSGWPQRCASARRRSRADSGSACIRFTNVCFWD